MPTIILENGADAKDVPHEEGVYFRCSQCELTKPVGKELGTGYARDDANRLICYACCAVNDTEHMRTHDRITLYLTCESRRKARDVNNRPFTPSTLSQGHGRNTKGTVSNWPGTLSIPCFTSYGNHNIAGTRYDCWFTAPDGSKWHGVTYGDNTQICHCRKLKTK